MLKRLKEVGGSGNLKILEASVFLLISIFNIIGIIQDKESIIGNYLYWMPFAVFSIVILFFGNRYLSAFLYYVLSISITLFVVPSESLSDFSGSIFFVFAYHQIKKPWAVFTVLITTISCIVFRSITMGDTIQGNSLMILIYFLVYGIYWLTIYHPEKKESFCNLCKEENKLLELMAEGLSQKEAGAVLGLDQSQANNYVKKIKRKTDSETLNQIMYKYGSINSNK